MFNGPPGQGMSQVRVSVLKVWDIARGSTVLSNRSATCDCMNLNRSGPPSNVTVVRSRRAPTVDSALAKRGSCGKKGEGAVGRWGRGVHVAHTSSSSGQIYAW